MLGLELKLGTVTKVGLLLVSLAYFSFSFYEMVIGSMEDKRMFIVMFTDLPGNIGLGFRTVGGFIAVVTVCLYIFRGHFTRGEALGAARFVVLCEAAYWLSLLPAGYWGVTSLPLTPSHSGGLALSGLSFFIETGLPCIVESILMPIVLVLLFYNLSPNRPTRNALKWGLVAGVSYLLVTWLNNMGNWVYTIMRGKDISYVTNYPANALTFATTTVGLLLLTIFGAYVANKTLKTGKLSLPTIGLIIMMLGLYMDVNYVLWLWFGSVGGWSTWYAWMLGHNMDQWLLALPLLGIPFLFGGKLEPSVKTSGTE